MSSPVGAGDTVGVGRHLRGNTWTRFWPRLGLLAVRRVTFRCDWFSIASFSLLLRLSRITPRSVKSYLPSFLSSNSSSGSPRNPLIVTAAAILFSTPVLIGQTTPNYTLETTIIEAAGVSDDPDPFLPAIEGVKINAGKKTSVIKLDELPVITNNNYRQALAKTPSFYLSEETTPLLSIGYRGLDPNRAQFTQMLKASRFMRISSATRRPTTPRRWIRWSGSSSCAPARRSCTGRRWAAR
jgi:hypothetical protein